MAEQPAGVPEHAVWSPDDDEWVLAPQLDEQGRRHGPVTFWRKDGSLVARVEYRDGTMHGSYIRYHESGEVARSARYDDGTMHGLDTSYRAGGPTTEVGFEDGVLEAMVRFDIEWVHGRAVTMRFFDRDGNELSQAGEPVPPRPDGVPDSAYVQYEGLWHCAAWDATTGPDVPVGLRRWWDTDGVLVRVEYYHAGEALAAVDRRPGEQPKTWRNPLLEAARVGDDEAEIGRAHV